MGGFKKLEVVTLHISFLNLFYLFVFENNYLFQNTSPQLLFLLGRGENEKHSLNEIVISSIGDYNINNNNNNHNN